MRGNEDHMAFVLCDPSHLSYEDRMTLIMAGWAAQIIQRGGRIDDWDSPNVDMDVADERLKADAIAAYMVGEKLGPSITFDTFTEQSNALVARAGRAAVSLLLMPGNWHRVTALARRLHSGVELEGKTVIRIIEAAHS